MSSNPREQFQELFHELTNKGWEVEGQEEHKPSRALGCVHVVRTLTAHKGRAKLTRSFIVSKYPLFLFSGKTS